MDIVIDKLRNKKFRFSIYDQDESPIDLTGSTAYFVIKTTKGEGRKVIIKSTDGDDMTIEGVNDNICVVTFVPEDTRNITPKSYRYELVLEIPEGGVSEWYTGVRAGFEVKDVLYNIVEE